MKPLTLTIFGLLALFVIVYLFSGCTPPRNETIEYRTSVIVDKGYGYGHSWVITLADGCRLSQQTTAFDECGWTDLGKCAIGDSVRYMITTGSRFEPSRGRWEPYRLQELKEIYLSAR